MNEFNKHKKSDKIKWLFTGIAFILVFVMIIGMCLQLFGKGKWKPSEWFEKPDTEQTSPELPDENGGALVSESANNGIKVMSVKIPVTLYSENSISPQAETAYALTATILPDSAIDKSVDWEISFKNPSSEWATDKVVTDYVTVTPTSDGALTANVECLQAFGEQIIVKVVSRDNPLATSTCQIDYAQKVTGVTLKLGDIPINVNGTTNFKWQVNPNGEGFGGVPSLSYTFSDVFTLEETVSYSVKFEKANPSINAFIQFGGKYWYSQSPSIVSIFGDITSKGIVFNRDLLNKFDFYYQTRNDGVHLNNLSVSEFSSFTSTIDNGEFANVVITVNGAYGSYEYTSLINISEFVNTASVTNVSLDNSSLVF